MGFYVVFTFFELGPNSTLEMFYAIFFLHLVLTIILNVIPKENQRRFFIDYHILKRDRADYYWDNIIKIRKLVFLSMLIYSALVIGLTHVYGMLISNVGIFVAAIVYVLGLSFGEPKQNKKVKE